MRTANRSETTNSKPPRRIIMIVPIRNSKEQQLDHIYYSSSPGLVRFAVAFMSLSSELYKLRQDWCQTPVQVTTRLVSNPFAEPNRYVLTFLHPILICRSYDKTGVKPLCWAKSVCFDFSSSNFNLQVHTTSEHALRNVGASNIKKFTDVKIRVWKVSQKPSSNTKKNQ
jgi:hypothetical protein